MITIEECSLDFEPIDKATVDFYAALGKPDPDWTMELHDKLMRELRGERDGTDS